MCYNKITGKGIHEKEEWFMKNFVARKAWEIYKRFNKSISHRERLSMAFKKAWRIVKEQFSVSSESLGTNLKKLMASKGVQNVKEDYNGISGTLVKRVLYADFMNGKVEGTKINNTYDKETKTIEIAIKICVAIDSNERNPTCGVEAVPTIVKKICPAAYQIGNFAEMMF